MGFAFLLAFTKFFPFQEQHDLNNSVRDNTTELSSPAAVKLDELPWNRSPDALSRIEKWVESGGKASLQSVGNICDVQNFEALKQTALKALQDLRVWGLAGKFYRTMKNFC